MPERQPGAEKASGIYGDPESVNIGFQQIAQCVVDQPVTRDGPQAVEAGGRDPDMKVAAAIPGSFMSRMQVAFVNHFKEQWIQLRTKAPFDGRNPVAGYG